MKEFGAGSNGAQKRNGGGCLNLMNTYLLFKSIHLIAVISWMAGLLYLPRIFIYHSEAVQNNKSRLNRNL